MAIQTFTGHREIVQKPLTTLQMITRIELTNFMSHEHTVIEPAAGLTVLVGPNNIGKSAIVAALQILCHNENSTYVLRHGARECSVRVDTDDGHAIEWRRKTAPSYRVDGQTFDRLRNSGTPPEVHQSLRLPKIDAADGTDIDVHFGTQKSPIFLLANSPANAARFFASSSDAICFVKLQKRHKEKASKAKQIKENLESESKQLNAELELLEPVVEVSRCLEIAECAYAELLQLDARLEGATKHEADLQAQAAQVAWRGAVAGTMLELSAPPELVPLEPLENLATALEAEESNRHAAESRTRALCVLSPPPEIAPTGALADLIFDTEAAGADYELARLQAEVIKSLPSPPAMREVAFLIEITERIVMIAENVARGEEEHRIFARLSSSPQLADTDPLRRVIGHLSSARSEFAVAGGIGAALGPVVQPPELSNETPLCETLSRLVDAAARAVRSEKVLAPLSTAPPPPALMETRAIGEFTVQLERADAHLQSCEANLKAAETECARAAAELRQQAVGRLCPVCGTALDPDRIVAHAVAGPGGHGHD